MKNLSKFIFLLVFALISASCGDKKESVYDEYPADDDSVNGISGDTDKTEPSSDKDSGNQAEEPDEDTGNGNEDSGNPAADEDENADQDNPDDSDETLPDEDAGNDSDDDTAESDDEPMDCTGFSLDPEDELTGTLPATIYTIKIEGNILGDPVYEDTFELRFDHHRVENDPYIKPGEYDLEKGDINSHNSNYWSCWECVSVNQDYANHEAKKFYFQKSGTLVIEEVDPQYNFKGTLSAVLVESTLENWVSSPVKNGKCLEIETAIEGITLCVPDCAGKENGESDGCDGTCGN